MHECPRAKWYHTHILPLGGDGSLSMTGLPRVPCLMHWVVSAWFPEGANVSAEQWLWAALELQESDKR